MKKHKKDIMLLAIVAGVIVVLTFSNSAKAEKSNLSGIGNFVFKRGEREASFYADDINFLQKEITTLFNEIEEDVNE